MSAMEYEVMAVDGGRPVKMWTRGVPVEDGARAQLMNVARMPFVHSHVAVMPDVHVGIGATVGSVVATRGAIIPAAVGVDLGCGMMAVATTLRERGVTLLAADGGGQTSLFDTDLARPTAWLFGNEAHGLGTSADVADVRVAIPIYGRAESLNLATAAAICLYSSARAQRKN